MRGTVFEIARAVRFAVVIVVLSATLGPPVLAQTAPPARMLRDPLAIDLAPGWVVGDPTLAMQAFSTRANAGVGEALHLSGQRMSDSPYALIDVERWQTPGLPTGAQQRAIADAVAEYFRTPVAPPSKAERSPSWKKAKLSSINYDPANNRFSFDATITYDFDGDRHVNVQGIFNVKRLYVLSIWSDDAYHRQNAPALKAMRDSFRFTGGNVNAVESVKQSFLSKTRWLVGFLVVAVAAAQVVIFVRDRRERQAERERLLDSVAR